MASDKFYLMSTLTQVASTFKVLRDAEELLVDLTGRTADLKKRKNTLPSTAQAIRDEISIIALGFKAIVTPNGNEGEEEG